jgi:hypothetical protein
MYRWAWAMHRMHRCPAPWPAQCTCRFSFVWAGDLGVVVYPRSRLLVWRGLLLKYRLPTECWLGLHKLNSAQAVRVAFVEGKGLLLMLRCPVGLGGWSETMVRVSLDLWRLRRLQRWWRRVLEGRWAARALAVAMAGHPRLGARSGLGALHGDLLRLCVAPGAPARAPVGI